jgi:hypothetical protein
LYSQFSREAKKRKQAASLFYWRQPSRNAF